MTNKPTPANEVAEAILSELDNFEHHFQLGGVWSGLHPANANTDTQSALVAVPGPTV